jgi:hypothetical protein
MITIFSWASRCFSSAMFPIRNTAIPFPVRFSLPFFFFFFFFCRTCSEIFEGLKHCNAPLEDTEWVAVAARITGVVRVQDESKKGRGCENVEREGNKAVRGSLRLWVVRIVKIVFGVFDIFLAFPFLAPSQ